jgi:hypothetical protein
MRKIFLVSCILFGLITKVLPSEIINNYMIADWYLSCNNAFICEVQQIDSLFIGKVDSIQPDSFVLSYKVIKEKYYINVDSTIKGNQSIESKTLFAAYSIKIDCKITNHRLRRW